MIIVCGHDNTGKTTLIETLAKEFSLISVKNSHMPTSAEDIRNAHNWAKAAPHPTIMDRHSAISDLVYGQALRNHSHSTLELALHVRKDNYLVFCCPSYETIAVTYNERPQLEGTHEKLRLIYDSYVSLMNRLEPDFIYDYKNPRALRALMHHIAPFIRRSL